MADISDLLGDPAPEDNPAPAETAAAPAKPAKKASKKADTAAVIPPALANAVAEQDPVFQAHLVRQANHHHELAPSIAKKAAEDAEREKRLQEQEIIAERNRKTREEAAAKQKELEEREGAAAKAAELRAEIEQLKASIKDKTAEADRLEKLAGGK